MTGKHFALAVLTALVLALLAACAQKEGRIFYPGPPDDDPPVITGGITTNVENPVAGQSIVFYVTATDPQGKTLTFAWSDGGGGGSFIGTGATVSYTNLEPGTYTITVTVTGAGGLSSTAMYTLVVEDTGINLPPQITGGIEIDNASPTMGDTVTLSVVASDPEGRPLAYEWSDGAAGGVFTGEGASVAYRNEASGRFTITVTVTDEGGLTASAALEVVFGDPSFPIIDRPAAAAGYVGKSACLTCHSGVVNASEFNMHRHNYKINPPTSDFIGSFWGGTQTLSRDGVTLDITMRNAGGAYEIVMEGSVFPVIRAMGLGKNKWKQRYIVTIGNSRYITPLQWNVTPAKFVPYNISDWGDASGYFFNGPNGSLGPGPAASFDRRCTACHTTGANVIFAEETGEWIAGWKEDNIQCEACHGPGEAHASAPSAANIVNPKKLTDKNRRVEVCGSCHGRGASTTMVGGKTFGFPWGEDGIFKPGSVLADYYVQTTDESRFWMDGADTASSHSLSHHQQYNDYIQSKHFQTIGMNCWDCHNVHSPGPEFTNASCTSCHAGIGADLEAHTNHAIPDMACIDCHMPYTSRNAIPYDVRAHTFKIVSPQVSMDMIQAGAETIMPNSCINGGCHAELSLTSEEDVAGKLADFISWWP